MLIFGEIEASYRKFEYLKRAFKVIHHSRSGLTQNLQLRNLAYILAKTQSISTANHFGLVFYRLVLGAVSS